MFQAEWDLSGPKKGQSGSADLAPPFNFVRRLPETRGREPVALAAVLGVVWV